MIEASHAQYAADLLKGQSGLVIRDTSGVGSKAQVDLGGFGESSQSNLVVTVDGRRVNSPDLSGVDWTQIPVDQIERIEIVHGASSVLYGDGAVGGVINIITRIPRSGGSVHVEGGSFGTSSDALRLGSDSGKSRVEVDLSHYRTDGYRTNSKYERVDGGGRAEVDLSDRIMLRVNGNYHSDRAGLPGGLSVAQAAADRRQAQPGHARDISHTKDGYADAGITIDTGVGVNLDVSGGFRKRDVSSQFVSYNYTSTTVLRTRSLRPKISYRADMGPLNTHLVAGSDLVWSDGQVSGFDYRRRRQGLYGKADFGVVHDRLHLSAGFRRESMDDAFGAGGATTISNRLNAWELGLAAHATHGLILRANYARSIRLPALDERYQAAVPAWAIPASLNTNLLPQIGRHISVGVTYVANGVSAAVSVSRADMTDEIYYDPNTFANMNYTSRTRHDVFRVVLGWNAAPLLHLTANYTHTRATFRGGSYSGNSIPAVPVNTYGVSWTANWLENLNTVLKVTHVGSSYFISDQKNANPKLAGYTLLGITANYRYHDVTAFVRGDNITNTRYSSYGSYTSVYPAPGIRVLGGASYHF